MVRSAAFRNNAFKFAEYHFDGVQVGRIGRQVKELRTDRFNRLLNAADLMHRQIVHDNDSPADASPSVRLRHCSPKNESMPSDSLIDNSLGILPDSRPRENALNDLMLPADRLDQAYASADFFVRLLAGSSPF
jgi:hypothetical protein